MPADVEGIAFVVHGAGDAADVFWVGLQDGHGDTLFREEIGGGETGRAGSNDDYGAGRHGWEMLNDLKYYAT